MNSLFSLKALTHAAKMSTILVHEFPSKPFIADSSSILALSVAFWKYLNDDEGMEIKDILN